MAPAVESARLPSRVATRSRSSARRGSAAGRREIADFRAAQRGDAQARRRLIEAYLPLSRSIARRFAGGGKVQLDDLQQVAAMGLVKAVDRFDPRKGVAFTSFAVPTIQGEIRRYFRDYTWAVRPPRDLLERTLRMERRREDLTSALGRSPTAGELAEDIGCDVEEIVEAAEAAAARTGDSLDGPCHAGDEGKRPLGTRSVWMRTASGMQSMQRCWIRCCGR
jgi:RNA polymerase sigma-B factor